MSFPAYKLPVIHHQLPLAVLQAHMSLHCCESLQLWIMHLPVFVFSLPCPPSPCIHYATQLLNYYRGGWLTFRASHILIMSAFCLQWLRCPILLGFTSSVRINFGLYFRSLEAIQKASNRYEKCRNNINRCLREETEKERSGKTPKYYLGYSSPSPFSQLRARQKTAVIL